MARSIPFGHRGVWPPYDLGARGALQESFLYPCECMMQFFERPLKGASGSGHATTIPPDDPRCKQRIPHRERGGSSGDGPSKAQ